MKLSTKKMVHAALMCAIVVALTLIVLPVPVTNGYVNLGDVGVYACAAAVGGPWGIVAAATGSMLADFILGYGVYAPATFIIKGAAAAVAAVGIRRRKGAIRSLWLLAAGVLIAGGYFLFEGLFVLDSFAAALVNLAGNLIQGAVGAALGTVVVNLVERLHLNV